MRFFIIVISTLFFTSVHGQNTTLSKNQLKGIWVSQDDKRYQVIFKDTLKQDYYDGKLGSSFRYWIKQDSLIAKDLSDGDIYKYSIEGLTESHLILMYLKRGNFLMFRKQSAANKSLAKKRPKT